MAEISPADERTSSVDLPEYGIITSAPKSAVSRAFGRSRTFVGLTWTESLFLGVSVLNILAALGLTIYQLVIAIQDTNIEDIIFTTLIIFNAVYCLFYTFHGLLRERADELYALIAASITILVYCIVQFIVNPNRSPVKLARLIAACILVPADVILIVLVVKDFGWLEFKIVGASEALQYMYRQTSKFSTLLKFDLQVTISFVILFAKLRFEPSVSITVPELVLLSLMIPFSVVWDMLGYIMMRKESKYGAFAFLFLGLIKLAFYLYKISKVYDALNNSPESSHYILYTMLTAAAVSLLVWLFLMVELHYVYQNFGKGLKERVYVIESKSPWRRFTSDDNLAT